VKRHAGSRTILGSGDLFAAPLVRRMIDETGVDGVTIARGAIGNPFIFRECGALLNGKALSPPSVAEQREAIEFHFAEALKLYNNEDAGSNFKKFGISYANLHPVREEVRQAFIQAKTTKEIRNVLDYWYDDQHKWPPSQPREVLMDLIAGGAEA
jgi:tRNA-dihydrouridine synthase B